MRFQKRNIKNWFLSRPNMWIPVTELRQFALQYNARIHELRRECMIIINKTATVNGEKHSWYMYIPPKFQTVNGQMEIR